jgi:hypothetical protein
MKAKSNIADAAVIAIIWLITVGLVVVLVFKAKLFK